MSKCYALYRGDEFIDLGTAKEFTQKHNITLRFFRWLASAKRWTSKDHERGWIVIKIEEDDEDEKEETKK